MMRTTGYSLSLTGQMQADGRVTLKGVHTPDEAMPFADYVDGPRGTRGGDRGACRQWRSTSRTVWEGALTFDEFVARRARSTGRSGKASTGTRRHRSGPRWRRMAAR